MYLELVITCKKIENLELLAKSLVSYSLPVASLTIANTSLAYR